MTTLTTAPVSTVLSRLLADAGATTAILEQTMRSSTPEEIAAVMRSTDYKATYSRMKDFHLAVSAETGTLLYMLARSSRARSIIEFGTSFGVSTLYLAAALRDNGGGHLIGSEFEGSKTAKARASIEAAGLADLVEIREGDALDTLARDLPPVIDLVLLDGAKPLYLPILSLLEPRLGAAALIVADNADWCPPYLEHVRSPAAGYLSVPFGANVEVSMKLGG
jgi:predicted O-methyltransferase YrrM